MSQRPPQPARDVKVQRRPELRLKRLLKPPATCGTRLAQLAESSIVLPHVNIQCAPADCPQREGLFPASVPVCRLLDDLESARLQDLHKLASI